MIELADRIAIETLYARTQWAWDLGDAEAFAAGFTQDGVLTMRESHKGAASLKAFIDRFRQDVAFGASHHVVSALLIEPQSARDFIVRAYVDRIHRLPTQSRGNCQVLWAGYTLDRCVMVGDRWLFAERCLRAWEGAIPRLSALEQKGRST